MTQREFEDDLPSSPDCVRVGDRCSMTLYSIFPCRCDSVQVVGKSTITGKYQLTLPKSVREFLRADNGDLIVFIRDHDQILVKRGVVKIEE
jgi:AbrB family looped-hinge helix DNA binding protein